MLYDSDFWATNIYYIHEMSVTGIHMLTFAGSNTGCGTILGCPNTIDANIAVWSYKIRNDHISHNVHVAHIDN